MVLELLGQSHLKAEVNEHLPSTMHAASMGLHACTPDAVWWAYLSRLALRD